MGQRRKSKRRVGENLKAFLGRCYQHCQTHLQAQGLCAGPRLRPISRSTAVTVSGKRGCGHQKILRGPRVFLRCHFQTSELAAVGKHRVGRDKDQRPRQPSRQRQGGLACQRGTPEPALALPCAVESWHSYPGCEEGAEAHAKSWPCMCNPRASPGQTTAGHSAWRHGRRQYPP